MTAATTDAGLLRSSGTMAVGTILSRVTGLIRTTLLAAALGFELLGDAFNVANTVPNIVYELLLGGVLTSVLVPLLVRAATENATEGELFARRLLSAVIAALALTTVVAVALAPQLMHVLLGAKATPDQLRIGTAFARFFLPQIFFYGVGATIGAILNTRGSFAAPMWAPVLNNLVVITTLIAFIATNRHPRAQTLTHDQLLLLGLGTTAGIVLQTVALLPALRRVGFPFRLTTHLQGIGLRRTFRLGAWTLVYVVANQAAFLVVVRLSTPLTHQLLPGFSIYLNAFLVFSLPHAIVAVSVISALLPQMSRHAAEGDLAGVARDLARGTRVSSVFLVPAALALIALHGPLAQVLFGYGKSAQDAAVIGTTVAVFAVGVVPMSAFQLQMRAFYSLADARTPALLNIAVNAVNVVADLVLWAVLPASQLVYGLAAGFALSYVVGWFLATRVLSSRLGRLGTTATVRTLVRLFLAGSVGAGAAFGLVELGAHTLANGMLESLAVVVLGSALTGAIVVFLAGRMRVTEVHELVAIVRRRAG